MADKKYNFSFPHELWVFLKKQSIDQNLTLKETIIKILNGYKKKHEKKKLDKDV